VLNDSNEIWKPIKDFEDYYEVSTKGRVRNKKGNIMKTYIINSGYECLKFTIKTKITAHLVHRLVAATFLPNTGNLREVNHIDGNKRNNELSNLEWCSSSDNKKHAFKTGLRTKESCMGTLGKKHKSKVSKYHNVGYDNSRNKWTASVRHNGVTYYQKRFNTEIEAALHVNWIIDKLNLKDRPKNIID